MDTPFIKNERYTYPQISVSVHLDRKKKRRSTEKDMHRISTMTTDQPWSEIYPSLQLINFSVLISCSPLLISCIYSFFT